MKCLWPNCGGLILGDTCHLCGRSPDIAHEVEVYIIQHRHKHRNLHGSPKQDITIYHINLNPRYGRGLISD